MEGSKTRKAASKRAHNTRPGSQYGLYQKISLIFLCAKTIHGRVKVNNKSRIL
jgi:hypothetical protein